MSKSWPAAVLTNRPTEARHLTAIDTASYHSGMGLSDLNQAARKESVRDALLPHRTDESDAFVEMWKREWLSGADAFWATQLAINPHADDPARAAWQAGADWAKDHPDRRTTRHLRLAHSNRRATDPGRRIPRGVKIGVFGFGLLAASRWVWRNLRRKPNGTIADSPRTRTADLSHPKPSADTADTARRSPP
jgi:hypothetical protein